MPVCITATDRDTLPVCMGQSQRQGHTCVYHGQPGIPYRCVWGKDRGRDIPVFIMDKIPVFIMDRQGHPTGVYEAKTEAGIYLCLSWTKCLCFSWTDRDTLPVCMGQRQRQGNT